MKVLKNLKLFHDFKKGYDAAKIIKEYTNSLSLKLEINENENKVKELYEHRISLQNLFSSLESQANMHKQTMSVYWELLAMKFGLSAIKQIWYTILEIASTRRNSRSSEDSVSIFKGTLKRITMTNSYWKTKLRKKQTHR